MAFIYENINETNTTNNEIGLGVKLTNLSSVFSTLYTIPEQSKENLKSLLLTRIGERYMLPEFGTNLLNLVFDMNSNTIKEVINDTITSAISVWLPYITIEELDIKTIEDDPSLIHTIEISLTYSVQNFSTDTIKIFVTDNTVTVA